MNTLWSIPLVKLEISPPISEPQKVKWNNREEYLRNYGCCILKCLTEFTQQWMTRDSEYHDFLSDELAV